MRYLLVGAEWIFTMSKFGIDTKAKKIALIINPKEDENTFSADFYPKLNAWLIQQSDIYAYILHDLDVDDKGEAKRPHIHVYAEMKACRRLMANLNECADVLGYDVKQISIDKVVNPTGVIQYLIHKNNPEKHQYEPKEIITNLSKGDLDCVLAAVAGNCSISFFKSCVINCKGNVWSLVEMVGLDVYKEYRQVINDLFRFYYRGI